MKKILVMLSALMVMGASSAFADDNSDWGLVCSLEELQRLNFGELIVSESSVYAVASSMVANTYVDTKHKTMKVWVLYMSTPEGRTSRINNLGAAYAGYGYTKMYKSVNINRQELEILHYTDYNCDGSVIHSDDRALGKQAIIPGSIDDTVIKDIRKKFKI